MKYTKEQRLDIFAVLIFEMTYCNKFFMERMMLK